MGISCNSNMQIPRMRTVEQCVALFKENDPNTKINKNGIRKMAKNQEIPVQWFGNKMLINVDALIEKLNRISEKEEAQEDGYGKIRKLEIG